MLFRSQFAAKAHYLANIDRLSTNRSLELSAKLKLGLATGLGVELAAI